MIKRFIPEWRIPILMYHQIDVTPANSVFPSMYIVPDEFERQMRYLYFKEYRVLSLDAFVKKVENKGRLHHRTVIITIDDGFKSAYTYAFPILKKYNFKATVFLIADLINKTNEWLQKKGEPTCEMLSEDQIKEMAEYGIDFGAHTCTHPDLTRIPPEVAKREIFESKRKIENLLETSIISFCYPYGNFNDTIKQMVIEAGFKCACAAHGYTKADGYDLFSLERIVMLPGDSIEFRLKISGYYSWLINLHLPSIGLIAYFRRKHTKKHKAVVNLAN